jgi:hypothetical protein
MTKLIHLSLMVTIIILLAPASFSQDDAKHELYQKFTAAYNRGRDAKKSDPNLTQAVNRDVYNQASKEAYQLAIEYVRRYPNDTDEVFSFQKKYIGDYEKWQKQMRKTQLGQYFSDKKYEEAFSLGRQILIDEPNDLLTLYTLARGGLFAATGGNDNYNSATIQYAKNAIQLTEAGMTLDGISKDETLGVLNYAIGVATLKTAPADALAALLQVAAQPNTSRNDPQVFYLLAIAYQSVDYEKLSAAYNTQCRAEPKLLNSEPCRALAERLNGVIDKITDSYARAIALSGSSQQYAGARTEWINSLTDFYKYRHGGKAEGLNDFIAGALARPMP